MRGTPLKCDGGSESLRISFLDLSLCIFYGMNLMSWQFVLFTKIIALKTLVKKVCMLAVSFIASDH